MMIKRYILKDLLECYKKNVFDYNDALKTMSWTELLTKSFSSLLICIAFALFCGLKEGTGDLYMSIFIPLFFTNSLILLYSCIHKSSDIYALLTIFLMDTGTALQIFMLPATDEGSLKEVQTSVFIILFAILVSALFVPLVKFIFSFSDKNTVAVFLMFIATILIYGVLLIFGTEINGTKAWLIIGNLSFQLTELNKIVAFLTFPLIMLNKKLSEKTQSMVLILLLCLHALFLVLINELGTLCVIFFTYFITRILFSEKRKYAVKEIAVFFLLASVVLTSCFGIYKMHSAQTVETEITQEQESSTEVSVDPTITNKPSTEKEPQIASQAFDKIISRIANIYPKLAKRVNVFLRTENASETDLYQINMAEKAMTVVSLFGTPRGSLAMVPEIDCDFVFIYLIVRLGIISTLLIFIALISMLIEVAVKSSTFQKSPLEYTTAFTFIASIVVQALLCSCSAIGLFPIIGLPFPFLSSGGTNLLCNIFMSIFIINTLENIKLKESCNNDEA